MEDYMGRARVFQQWGDDQETVEIAIETCPVGKITF
jgi:ferredoxin